MAVTVQTIKTRLPEFERTDNGIIEAQLEAAQNCINREQWGENRADEGTIYLTGHFLKFLEEQSGLDSGPVTAEREGGIAVSYAVADDAKNSVYGSTVYGRHYLELRRTAFPERFVL
jgi:hypothetical protein